MRLSAHFDKRLHGMCMFKHAQLYRSASAAGWLTAGHTQHAGHRQPYDLNSSMIMSQMLSTKRSLHCHCPGRSNYRI